MAYSSFFFKSESDPDDDEDDDESEESESDESVSEPELDDSDAVDPRPLDFSACAGASSALASNSSDPASFSPFVRIPPFARAAANLFENASSPSSSSSVSVATADDRPELARSMTNRRRSSRAESSPSAVASSNESLENFPVSIGDPPVGFIGGVRAPERSSFIVLGERPRAR